MTVVVERRCVVCEAEMELPDECHECLHIKASKGAVSRFRRDGACAKGHEYSPENLFVEVKSGKTSQRCRPCLLNRRRVERLLRKETK